MAEKRHFGPIRKTATALVVALVALGAIVVPTPAPAGANCALVPALRDVTINQGVGSYTPLTRGKQTLVRFYLSKPECDKSTAVIEVTGADLLLDGVPVPVNALPEPASPYQPVPAWTSSPVADGGADPKFLVPGEIVDRPDAVTPGNFEIGFAAQINYQVRPQPGAPPSQTGTVLLDRVAGTTTTIKGTFGPRPQPLRILVVPMGDPNKPLLSQFPEAAIESVQTGMQTVSRLLPVPDGVGPLTTTGTEGVRYAIAPKIFDVTAYMTGAGGKFCPTSNTAIAKALRDELAVYNSKSAGRAADRILGAIWHDISLGTESGCADGYATVKGGEAWSRVFPNDSANRTGSVFTHEMLHTFGDVAPKLNDGTWNPRHDSGSSYHSINREADVSSPDRAYNLATRAYIADDRAIGRIEGDWRDEKTLLELEAWNIAQCTLTPGSPAGACALPGRVGGALAGPSFVVTGRSDGSKSGTDLHSYYSGNAFRPHPDGTSSYRLVQRDSTRSRILKNEGIPVDSEGADSGSATHDSALISFATEIAESDDATRRAEWFEVWFGNPADPDPAKAAAAHLLYERRRGDPPTVVSSSFAPVGTGLTNLTGTGDTSEANPAVAPGGDLVAWESPAGTTVKVVNGSAQTTIAGAADPAFDKVGSRVAYVRNSNVYVRSVSSSTSGVAFGAERLVYDATVQQLPQTRASGPTFSGDGNKLAVAVNGDIWSLDLQFQATPSNPLLCSVPSLPLQPCQRVTSDPLIERQPDWGANGRIAYVRESTASEIWTIDPVVGMAGDTGLRGEEPAWGAELLTFSGPSGVQVVSWKNVVGGIAVGTPSDLTTGLDSSPSLSANGNTLVFARLSEGQSDVYLLDIERRRIEVTLRDNDNPNELRADVFLVCSDITYVLFAALKPTTSSGSAATFVAEFDPALACDGDVVVRGTDGYNTVETTVGTVRRKHGPTASIATPASGSEILQFDPLSVRGAAVDPEGEVTSGASFAWRLTSPGEVVRDLGSGPYLPDLAPPDGGWTHGVHTLTLTVTYLGEPTTATSTFTVLPDDDRDRIPALRDGCDGAGDNDPYNAYADDDGDGIPNVDDRSPCKSSNNATGNFDPDTLSVGSNGTPVTIYISSETVNLSSLSAADVAITRIGQWSTWIPATSWRFEGGQAVAKFDRPSVNAFLIQKGLVGRYVPFAVSTGGPAPLLRAVDPVSPNVSS